MLHRHAVCEVEEELLRRFYLGLSWQIVLLETETPAKQCRDLLLDCFFERIGASLGLADVISKALQCVFLALLQLFASLWIRRLRLVEKSQCFTVQEVEPDVVVGQISYSNQPLVKKLSELLQFGQLLLLCTTVFLLSFLGLDLPPEASDFALCAFNCPKLLVQRVQALLEFVLKIDVPFNQRTRLADAGD